MNRNKMYLIAMMLLPWFSLPLLGKRTIKKFGPSTAIICLMVIIEIIVAHKKRWWVMYEKVTKFGLPEIPFILGPFFVGSLWILKFTYGKFLRYLIVNFITDSLFAYPGVWVLKRLGIASLVRFKHWQFFLLVFYKAIFMYGFQGLFNKLQRKL